MPFVVNGDAREVLHLTSADGARLTLYRQGAHVTSWIPAGAADVLYLSPKAVFKDGTALRGGVPIIFPQFSDMGSGPTHGFARNQNWELESEGDGQATLKLSVRPGSHPAYPTASLDIFFAVRFTSHELALTLSVTNVGAELFSFSTAMHTYFAVSRIDALRITGLDSSHFADNLKKREVFPPQEIRSIGEEVDRIYFDVAEPVVLADTATGRSVIVSGKNLTDVVLWNPWIEKTKRLSDMPPDGYLHFVCVEHGSIRAPHNLQPGERWEGSQVVAVKSLSAKI